jgi:outer membrane lipoprotein-sorting protein
MIRRTAVVIALIVITATTAPAEAQDAAEIVRASIDNWRGKSSFGEMTMTIHRPSWERTMSMRAWTQGSKETLVRVTAPKKDAGNGTLMVDNNMWSYAPKVNRVIKVPSSMMGQSWMGSDFSNKDVSRADNIVDEYDHSLLGEEEHEGHAVYVIESVPHEEAAVVWGKEVLHGVLAKVLESLEIGVMGGRSIAIRQRMTKADTEDEWTEFRIDSVEFDIEISDNVFTRSNLQNPRE